MDIARETLGAVSEFEVPLTVFRGVDEFEILGVVTLSHQSWQSAGIGSVFSPEDKVSVRRDEFLLERGDEIECSDMSVVSALSRWRVTDPAPEGDDGMVKTWLLKTVTL